MSLAIRGWLAGLSPWARYALIAALLGVLSYRVVAWAWPWQPGRLGGLVFGTFAAVLFINASLYPWRRRWETKPLGTAQRWLKLHVYGSVLAFWFVLIHAGFRWPAGTMGWLLLLLSFWATATGLLGIWLQRMVPPLMARRLTVEAIYERIPELVAALVVEADALMAGAPETLSRAYAGEIRPMLATTRPTMQWLTGSAPLVVKSGESLNRIRPFVGSADRPRLDDLEAILQDKLDLDAQMSLQRVLRGWLILHVPPAILLIGLMATHIVAVVLH